VPDNKSARRSCCEEIKGEFDKYGLKKDDVVGFLKGQQIYQTN
jgi:hypothetical protein